MKWVSYMFSGSNFARMSCKNLRMYQVDMLCQKKSNWHKYQPLGSEQLWMVNLRMKNIWGCPGVFWKQDVTGRPFLSGVVGCNQNSIVEKRQSCCTYHTQPKPSDLGFFLTDSFVWLVLRMRFVGLVTTSQPIWVAAVAMNISALHCSCLWAVSEMKPTSTTSTSSHCACPTLSSVGVTTRRDFLLISKIPSALSLVYLRSQSHIRTNTGYESHIYLQISGWMWTLTGAKLFICWFRLWCLIWLTMILKICLNKFSDLIIIKIRLAMLYLQVESSMELTHYQLLLAAAKNKAWSRLFHIMS